MARCARPAGFTLLELLLATSLFALLGTLLFQVTRSAMDLWVEGERDRDLHDRASTALEVVAEDLRHAWLGHPGASVQDARLLCSMREQDLDGDGVAELRAPVLRFTRLCHEARALDWLRHAGDAPGGRGVATLDAADADAALQPTGGLAESLYTLALVDGQELPVLFRRFRSPIDRDGSLTAPGLVGRSDRLLQDGIAIAHGVLHFGVELWGPDTTRWSDAPGGVPDVALRTWDSTRGVVPPHDPSFPYGVGSASYEDPRDDLFPSRIRLVLELDPGSGAGRLAEAVGADATRVTLSSARLFQGAREPDFVLVDHEWMRLVSRDGRRLRVERGARGSPAVGHDLAAPVRVGRRLERVVALPAARAGVRR